MGSGKKKWLQVKYEWSCQSKGANLKGTVKSARMSKFEKYIEMANIETWVSVGPLFFFFSVYLMRQKRLFKLLN